jgi:hypothetical protein
LCQIAEDGKAKCTCTEGWEGDNCTTGKLIILNLLESLYFCTHIYIEHQIMLLAIDYSGCSAFSKTKCEYKDDIIIEKLEGVTSIENCQFYCSVIYSEECKYFVFDRTMETCEIMNTINIDTCTRISGGWKPEASFCESIFEDGIYEHSCLVRLQYFTLHSLGKMFYFIKQLFGNI